MAEEDVGGYYSVLRLKVDEASFNRGKQKAKEFSQTLNQQFNNFTKNDFSTKNYYSVINNYAKATREGSQRIENASKLYSQALRSLGMGMRAFSHGNIPGGAYDFSRFMDQWKRAGSAKKFDSKGNLVSAGSGGGGNVYGKTKLSQGMGEFMSGISGGILAAAGIAVVAAVVAGVAGKKIIEAAAKETTEAVAAKYSNMSIAGYSALNGVGTATGVGRSALQGSLGSLDQKYQALKTGNVDTEMIKSVAMLGVSFHKTRYMDSEQRYATLMNAALRMRDERMAGLLIGNVLGEAGAKQFYFTKQTGISFGQQMSDSRRAVFTTNDSKSFSAQTSYMGGMLGSAAGSLLAYGGAQLGRGAYPMIKALFDLITHHKAGIQNFLRKVGDSLWAITYPVKLVINGVDWLITGIEKMKSGLYSLAVNSPLKPLLKGFWEFRVLMDDIMEYFTSNGKTKTAFGVFLQGLSDGLHKTFGWLFDAWNSMFNPKLFDAWNSMFNPKHLDNNKKTAQMFLDEKNFASNLALAPAYKKTIGKERAARIAAYRDAAGDLLTPMIQRASAMYLDNKTFQDIAASEGMRTDLAKMMANLGMAAVSANHQIDANGNYFGTADDLMSMFRMWGNKFFDFTDMEGTRDIVTTKENTATIRVDIADLGSFRIRTTKDGVQVLDMQNNIIATK